MEIRQLRYFIAVARERSFVRAASSIFVSQSALSHQIAQLEAELGVQLFDRSNRGTTLTSAGETFHLYASSILQQLEAAQASVRQPAGAPIGKVSIGIPPSVCHALAVPLLKTASRQLPGIKLELIEEATGRLSERLKNGMLNLAILFDDGAITDFATQPLLDEQLSLLRKASWDLREKGRGPSIRLKEALQKPLFLAAPTNGVRRIVNRAAQERKLPLPDVVADINSVAILRATVLAGLGATILPAMAVKEDIDAGLIYAQPIMDPMLTRRVMLCHAKEVVLTPAAQATAHLIEQVAKQLMLDGTWIEAKIST